ncbi:PREDICTED: metal transporter CNNM4-like [Papilio polytes]|uniref:metal transporter CNNM4-like n=1 Tax=Papilio polytes TaxID=76194 RepID=UPI00067651FB|nr:PREDICTED: metal transporter CNNM4-like [Papilio polytes]
MAAVRSLRTSGVFLLLFLLKITNASSGPWIFSVDVNEKACSELKCVYNLNVNGLDIDVWSLTEVPAARGGDCEGRFLEEKSTKNVELIVPVAKKLFFCAKGPDGVWYNQGESLFLEANDVIEANAQYEPSEIESDDDNEVDIDNVDKKLTDAKLEVFDDIKYLDDLDVNRHGVEQSDLIIETFAYPTNTDKIRIKRQIETDNTTELDKGDVTLDNASVVTGSLGAKVFTNGNVKVMGLRVEEGEKPKIVDGLPSVLREYLFTVRLFGEGFTESTEIAFTHIPADYGTQCVFLLPGEHKVKEITEDSALFELIAPALSEDNRFYICARNANGSFYHQGSERWKILAVHDKLLPLWASLILIVILLMLASLFSGLNLGLMALDRTELKIIANTGTEKERKYARAIMPVRAHGNYLLCTILLSNVAVNSTFTVILDDLTSGVVAVIGSTLAIVFIAEITPQAICARHGLLIGAKSIWIMKIVMGICAPLAWPTSKLLDYFLGEEIGTHYNRERLKELVKVTNHVNDLDKEEVNIISGALDLRKKTVKDVMTKLKDCYMLPITSVLDFETMSEIVKSGYSRIPVYEGNRGNIVTVLFIKDLAFVDPDDNTPLKTLCQYYQNPCNFVFEDITLDVMLKQFKEGHKGHMAFVQRIEEGDGDPVYETVGLVTLEDVIEEMIQAEIVDETDVISDNRTKKRLARPLNKFQDLASFAGHQPHRVHVSPQLVLATFQFLSTSVDAFRADMISETVLRRLLKQDVIHHIKLRGDEDKNDLKRYVFQEGKPVDYFVLILEGRVEVTVGRENLVFEAGPFTYFGVQALTQNIGVAETPAPSTLGSLQNLNMDSMLRHTFVPDYSVRAIAELYYLTIKRSMYLAAKRATLMEKGALTKGNTNEQIEPEVDKLLRDGDKMEDIPEHERLPKQFLPTSASPHTNSTFKNKDGNPEEEKLLK